MGARRGPPPAPGWHPSGFACPGSARSSLKRSARPRRPPRCRLPPSPPAAPFARRWARPGGLSGLRAPRAAGVVRRRIRSGSLARPVGAWPRPPLAAGAAPLRLAAPGPGRAARFLVARRAARSPPALPSGPRPSVRSVASLGGLGGSSRWVPPSPAPARRGWSVVPPSAASAGLWALRLRPPGPWSARPLRGRSGWARGPGGFWGLLSGAAARPSPLSPSRPPLPSGERGRRRRLTPLRRGRGMGTLRRSVLRSSVRKKALPSAALTSGGKAQNGYFVQKRVAHKTGLPQGVGPATHFCASSPRRNPPGCARKIRRVGTGSLGFPALGLRRCVQQNSSFCSIPPFWPRCRGPPTPCPSNLLSLERAAGRSTAVARNFRCVNPLVQSAGG